MDYPKTETGKTPFFSVYLSMHIPANVKSAIYTFSSKLLRHNDDTARDGKSNVLYAILLACLLN
jgi:hypothetical protein